MSAALWSLVLAAVAAYFYLNNQRQEQAKRAQNGGLPLPPGPSPLPLVGNILDLTAKELWLTTAKWAKQYGDIVYVHVFGQGLVFLNTAEANFQLLDKKGSWYSDKPHLVMACDLVGCKNMVAFTPYGDRFKQQRKIIAQALGPQAIPSYHPEIAVQTVNFIRRLAKSPEDYVALTRTYAGSLTLGVVYGYSPKPSEDPYLRVAGECVDILANEVASGGGIWPVDIFPVLQYLPDWAPGSAFLRKAKVWKQKMEDFTNLPYEFLKTSMATGKYTPSFCSTALEEHLTDKMTPDEREKYEFELKWTANSMYSASMDTTITFVGHFLLAMMSHPEVLQRAQDEIDGVTGGERLPTFSDRQDLPYAECVMNEVLRWGVPTPLNLPHRLTQDDVFEGKRIPAGSLVFGNIWTIARDPVMFPAPDQFRPERYWKVAERDAKLARKMDPRNFVFGFGRRVCPGEHLVESSIWLLLVTIMATMDVRKAVDEFGKVVEPEVRFENSVFRNPSPFKVDIRPRNEAALRLIMESE